MKRRPRAERIRMSDRLVFRCPELEDAEQIFGRYASDPEVTHYLGWARHQSVEDSKRFIEFSRYEWQRAPAGPYLIHLRNSGQLIGSTGLMFAEPGMHTVVTGYVLARDAWGFGYATEALQSMVELARWLRVHRVCAACHSEHGRSIRVLEKCQFVRDDRCVTEVSFPNLSAATIQRAEHWVLHISESH